VARLQRTADDFFQFESNKNDKMRSSTWDPYCKLNKLNKLDRFAGTTIVNSSNWISYAVSDYNNFESQHRTFKLVKQSKV